MSIIMITHIKMRYKLIDKFKVHETL